MSDINNPAYARLNDSRLRARLTTIRDSVESILATNTLPNFTDHSVSHSDCLCTIVDSLTEPMVSTAEELSFNEAFVLYAACYLHDIGMQHQKANDTEVIQQALTEAPYGGQRWQDLTVKTQRELLREYHHLISAEMVKMSVDAAQPTILGVQLVQSDNPGYIASLCAAHCVSPGTSEYNDLVAEGPNLRMPLLAALLRLADILDESRRRAQLHRELTVDLDVTSRMHWWRHYYVEDVTFEAKKRAIKIWFDFPPNRREEYRQIVPDLQIHYLENELSQQQAILCSANLSWWLIREETPEVHSVAIEMPNDVQIRMAKELRQRRANALQTQRSIILRQLRENRPVIKREIEKLHADESNITPDDYLRRAVELTHGLQELGGRHDAWMLLWSEWNGMQKRANPAVVMETGIALCRMMLDDNAYEMAARQLGGDLRAIAGTLTEKDPMRLEWLRLFASALVEQCDYKQAVEFMNELVRLLPQETTWNARLAEVHFLQGELEASEAFTSPEGGSHCDTTDTLRSDTRLMLVQVRVIGMQQGLEAALGLLDTFMPVFSKGSMDYLALTLAKAELQHLDHCDMEAQDTFDNCVQPCLEGLPPEVAVLLADNGSLISMSLLTPDQSRFYHLVDQRRLLGVQLNDNEAAAQIGEAVRKGKHYDALPICWQQLLRAYESMCWRRVLLAELEMARECLALNWPHEAAYHGMLSCDNDVMTLVGEQLVKVLTPEAIRRTLDMVLPVSRLTRHAVAVARLLGQIADLIPDNEMPNVIDWLLIRAKYEPSSLLDASLLEPTWRAVTALSQRLSAKQALSVIEIGLDHAAFTNPTVYRRHIIDSINACVRQVDPVALPQIAEKVLPLALDKKSDIDFIAAINLLCHLAERGGNTLRKRLRSALYPPEKEIKHAALIQAARHFDVQLNSTDELDQTALQIAKCIRQQVQRLAPEEQPATLGGYGTVTASLPDGRGQLVVHMGSALHNLEAVVEHRKQLSDEPLYELVTSVLEMIGNSDNIIGNRVALVQSLQRLVDRLSAELAQQISAILLPLANGEITESQASMSHAEATNPLNPFKINTGNPTDLRCVSIITLAEIENRFPHAVNLHDGLLSHAMSHPDAKVRALSFVAAGLASYVTPEEQFACLLGTADADEHVVENALSVFCNIEKLHMETFLWDMLVTCLERTKQSPHPGVRCTTARVIQRVLMLKIPEDTVSALRQLQDALSADPSYAVRATINKNNSQTRQDG